jgi:hypothetical protein
MLCLAESMERVMDAALGFIKVNTGNPYLDIGGVVFIALTVMLGYRFIRRIKIPKETNADRP